MMTNALYKDPAQPIDAQCKILLAQMTLEKIAQIGSAWITTNCCDGRTLNQEKMRDNLMGYQPDHPPRWGQQSRPDNCATSSIALQRYLVEETRLGIRGHDPRRVLQRLYGTGMPPPSRK
ncbi:MAG: hypothetical protein R2932_60075 [Caldilineaceae bacterium]